jgi:hypothetical protein
MKVQIEPDSVKFYELKSKPEAKFPTYIYSVRTKNTLVASKSMTIGANVLFKKEKIMVI